MSLLPYYQKFLTCTALLALLCLLAGELRAGSPSIIANPIGATATDDATMGSGNEFLRVIPTLSPYSLKDGEKLYIRAVLKSRHEIKSVEADLGGVTKLSLKLNPLLGAGQLADGTRVGIYEAEWTAVGLQELVYTVRMTITDVEGNRHVDSSLTFSDPAAGNSTPGTPASGVGHVERAGTLDLMGNESDLTCAVIDPELGYAFFGTNTHPARVVKVSLGAGNAAPVAVSAVELPGGEDFLTCAVIDTARDFAYFGTNTIPGRVVKVALGEQSFSPSRIGAVILPLGENNLRSAVIDAANGYAYFGTDTSPGKVVKIALGNAQAAPTRVGSLTLDAGENRLLCGVIDPGNGYAYFGTYTSPGRVVKVSLGLGTSLPTRVGAVTLNALEDNLSAAVIDTTTGYALFASYIWPETGRMVKIQLGVGNQPPVRNIGITLGTFKGNLVASHPVAVNGYAFFSDDYVYSANVYKYEFGTGPTAPVVRGAFNSPDGGTFPSVCIDASTGYGYVGQGRSPGKINKFNIGTGSASPSGVNTVSLSAGENDIRVALLDSINGYAYLASATLPAKVTKVRLGEGLEPPRRIASVTLPDTAEGLLISGVIDPQYGYAYFGTQVVRGTIVQIALGVNDAPPVRVTGIETGADEGGYTSAVADLVNGYAYFASPFSTPAKIVKMRMQRSTNSFTKIGSVSLLEADGTPTAAIIDPARGYVYFGTNTAPGRIVKLSLGGGNAPLRIGALTLNPGEDFLRGGVIDSANNQAYFITNTAPGRVVKVGLGTNNGLPQRLGAVTFPQGADYPYTVAADFTNGHLIIGHDANPSNITKVAISSAGAPVHLGTANPSIGDTYIRASIIDPANRLAYFATGTAPSRFIKTQLGEGDALPTRLSMIMLNNAEGNIKVALPDLQNRYAYYGAYTTPGRVLKVRLGSQTAPQLASGSLILNSAESYVNTGVINTTTQQAFFGTDTTPGRIVKVALGSGDTPPTRLAALTLSTGEDRLGCAVIDAANGHAYFGTITSPGRIVKVNLGTGITAPTKLGTLSLDAGENNLRSAVVDLTNRYAYFGTGTAPGRVVKVSLGDGSTMATRVGSVTLEAGEDDLRAAVIDPTQGFAVFGTYTNPGRAVKVMLGAGAELPQRIGAVTFTNAQRFVNCATYDSLGRIVYLGTDTEPGQVIRIAAGAGNTPPTPFGAMTLEFNEIGLGSGFFDQSLGYSYFASGTNPAKIIRSRGGSREALRGMRIVMPEAGKLESMNFYTHRAGDFAIFSLYNDNPDKQLLWTSGFVVPPTANDVLSIPIASGTPSSLIIPAGTYWLTWQSNSTSAFGSYTPGTPGSGFLVQQSFGITQDPLPASQIQGTSEVWTQYLIYEAIATKIDGWMLH